MFSTPIRALLRFLLISAGTVAISGVAGAQQPAGTKTAVQPPAQTAAQPSTATKQTGTPAPAPKTGAQSATPPAGTKPAAPQDQPSAAAAQTEAQKQMQESIDKQKAAIRQQVGDPPENSFFTTPWTNPLPALPPPPSNMPPCDPLLEDQVEPLIAKAAADTQVDVSIIREVIRRESGFFPCVVSSKGAMGMMQLMPDTAKRFNVADAFDAAQNIAAGAQYLKEMLDRFGGQLDLALAAYNAGPQTVDQAGGIPNIPETQNYVKAIMDALHPAKPAEEKK